MLAGNQPNMWPLGHPKASLGEKPQMETQIRMKEEEPCCGCRLLVAPKTAGGPKPNLSRWRDVQDGPYYEYIGANAETGEPLSNPPSMAAQNDTRGNGTNSGNGPKRGFTGAMAPKGATSQGSPPLKNMFAV